MTLSDDLATFDWAALASASPRPTLDGYRRTVQAWLAASAQDESVLRVCASLEPILDLRPAWADDAPEPFVPYEAFRALQPAHILPFAAVAAAIPLVDLRAHLIDLAWQKRAIDVGVVAQAVEDYAGAAQYLLGSESHPSIAMRLRRALTLSTALKLPQVEAAKAGVDAVIAWLQVADPMRIHLYVKLSIEHRTGNWSFLETLCRQCPASAET